MKDLLSKEYYCYEVHALLMKNCAYSLPFTDTLIYGSPPPPYSYKKILRLLFYDFRKSQTPHK